MLINTIKKISLDKTSGWHTVCVLASIFFLLVSFFALHRFYSFYASYDQALFDQLFWNTIHGHFFQGSLSSGQSSAVIADGQIHKVFYNHLGQHFVIDFILWLPIYALFPTGATLVILQVALMAAAGFVLYALARHYLPTNIAVLIVAGYFGANTVIGPTFANFYEHCQIPLFVFSMLLAFAKRKWSWFWLFVALTLGIREDTGITLFGFGLYLIYTRRHARVGIALCLVSFAYVSIVTNQVMALFSNDNSRLYLREYFGKFVPGNNSPSTLQLLWGMLTHPVELFKSLLTPFDRRVRYMLNHWLPLLFVPAISPAAWITTSPPLLVLLLQERKSALGVNIRYALTVMPGIYYGAIIWWSQNQERFNASVRRWWVRCIILSLIFTVTSSPNRAFYFLIPESFNPWMYTTLTSQWEHVGHIRALMNYIPASSSVSTTTYLLPHLATRREIIRLPHVQIENDFKQIKYVDFILADVWRDLRYQKSFQDERVDLVNFASSIDKLINESKYGIIDIQDDVILLQKQFISKPEVLSKWSSLRTELQR
ncbi:hypothetical protein NIES4071_60510 [Calothrix sp. NIES-4071]|nr:hypothetical protein NIES4071_60510 [Calothrix sp. NIES-4071]BAZ60358.1 hypothetical protein NIES4105_60460 [Calothrix sp. NIES-4105]